MGESVGHHIAVIDKFVVAVCAVYVHNGCGFEDLFSMFFSCSNVQNFDVRSLDLFADYLYHEVLELVDLDWAGRDHEAMCRKFHIMPRFARDLPGGCYAASCHYYFCPLSFFVNIFKE